MRAVDLINGGYRGRNRRFRHAVIPILLLSLAGCGDATKPEAIWCETGTGPGEVVYPRALTYDDHSDTFYLIDRTAHVQRLNHEGRCVRDWQMPEWQLG